MLLTILARMSNDEQRWQLLQTLRNKLSNYNLHWLDIRNIIDLFSPKDEIRFDILQFLLTHLNNLTEKLHIEDYVYLSNQCTNENEQLKVRLFEQIYEKLHLQNKDDLERISNLFQAGNVKQKIDAILRRWDKSYEEVVTNQLLSTVVPCEYTTAKNTLSPTLSCSIQELYSAPLKRKYSFDNEYQNHTCHQMIIPSSIIQQDEFIQQRDLNSSISISSSSSSFSSASDGNIPIRTRSFMIAIKNTFERLKETSS